MTRDFVTFSGEFVMHKSIRVLESEVTHVGSLINWLRPYIKNICQKGRNVSICFMQQIAVDITK